ncbi:MAG: hypothetical protein R6V10_16480 [bacterium]
MKKLMIAGILMVALAMPAWSAAEVEAAAGNISLHGHIDYVYRYSEADDGTNDDNLTQDWNGYDTQNLEFAVLGMSGQVGDNVDWLISYAFAFMGPTAATQSEALTGGNNNVTGTLLDARINIGVADMMTLSFGRFIPPTSMTWAPHQMSKLHTVNYPLIHGSGIAGGEYNSGMLPLPMYQTGMMLSANVGPAKIMVGGFNGNQFMGGDDGDVGIYAMNNNMDIDRNKGILAKVAVDQEGMHFGGWYYAEDASADMNPTGTATDTKDGSAARWGIEGAYEANNLLIAAEYIQSSFDFQDSADAYDENLVQNGWYFLAGYTMNQFQVVARYDQVNYDTEEEYAASGLLDPADYNEESAITAGVNYLLNEQTTVGLNYTMRDLENYEPAADELALILELDLF